MSRCWDKEKRTIDAIGILSHMINDLPNIRASLWIVRFRSLFLLSAFVLPRFSVSIAPHIQNSGYTRFRYPLSSVVVLSLPLSFSLVTTPEKIHSLQRCHISPPGPDLILVDARRAYQRCRTSAWALSSCARKCRESVDVCSSLGFRNFE